MRYVVDAKNMRTREEAHEYLAQIFEFPEYYGRNLDALYDMLSEWKDVEVEIVNRSEEDAKNYVRNVIRVMKDAGIKIM